MLKELIGSIHLAKKLYYLDYILLKIVYKITRCNNTLMSSLK